MVWSNREDLNVGKMDGMVALVLVFGLYPQCDGLWDVARVCL
jgi:hypothetical protein